MSRNDPVETARVIVSEGRQAAERTKASTDWAEFGRAAGEKCAIYSEAPARLDGFLKLNRLPGDES